MAGKNMRSARTIATTVLNKFDADPKQDYAGPILNKLLRQTGEKQRATDLVFGTIRSRSAIDTVIAKLADCPTERIPANLLNIIRIGAYELIYSPQTAEYAIVNETVENTKAIKGKKQAGFVNALLRQITRHIQNRQIPLSKANMQRVLPQTPSSGCEFDTDILPNPKDSPADFLSAAFSLPKWLVTDWLSEFGAELTRQICFASNRRPSIYIRPNTLKKTTQELAQKFHQADIGFEISADESMIKIKSPRDVVQLPGFAEGLFSVQDITASQPVRLLNPQPKWTILDLCAAPGTKTTQLAELTGDKTKIIATDIDPRRLEKVKENTVRLGINSVNTVAYENLKKTSAEIGPFDCILLDVPCSNTGVLAKRPEVRLKITPKAIVKLTKIQSQLLETATTMIKPKGKICYSTCSIQSSENSRLVKGFLRKNSRLKLESELLTLPSAQSPDRDGGYVAIITGK
jgi:16S rRNA (cytosine967-C5)-methyltransferase